jgi:hypothetical protein
MTGPIVSFDERSSSPLLVDVVGPMSPLRMNIYVNHPAVSFPTEQPYQAAGTNPSLTDGRRA